MREGSAETTVAAAPAIAFALLADPRNASLWFADGALANAPEGALRADMTWTFLQGATGKERAIPARMATYEPPTRFAWQTTNPAWNDNLRWEISCLPEPTGPDAAPDAAPATRMRLTIKLLPGPLGWISLLLAAPFARRNIEARAHRAIERARDAIETWAVPALQSQINDL